MWQGETSGDLGTCPTLCATGLWETASSVRTAAGRQVRVWLEAAGLSIRIGPATNSFSFAQRDELEMNQMHLKRDYS